MFPYMHAQHVLGNHLVYAPGAGPNILSHELIWSTLEPKLHPFAGCQFLYWFLFVHFMCMAFIDGLKDSKNNDDTIK